ncbi:MAG: DUF3147 family protein [Actinobacteria bacterium]|nr:DUF3147 family protein [Actinomycetota bacterium]
MAVLVLKLTFGPALVVASSVAARRFGSRVGGVLATFPAITGSILLVLALDHGRRFAREAATGALLGVVGPLAFVLAYTALSRRFGWRVALAGAWATFAPVAAVLRPVHVGPATAFAVAGVGIAFTLVLLPRVRTSPPTRPDTRPRWDLAVRVGCTILPIVLITGAAKTLGPQLSGIVSAFPITSPILVAFTHSQLGAAEARGVLRGVASGMVAYSSFCFAVSVGLGSLATGPAFALGVVVIVVAQAALLAAATQKRPPRLRARSAETA